MTTPDPSDADARPWERPGAVWRDCEPHRGPALRLLGAAAAVAGIAGALLAVMASAAGPLATLQLFALAAAVALPALPLGAGVFWAARRDLARMRAGQTDPGGKGPTDVAEA